MAAAQFAPGARGDWTFLANLLLHSIVSRYRAESATRSSCWCARTPRVR